MNSGTYAVQMLSPNIRFLPIECQEEADEKNMFFGLRWLRIKKGIESNVASFRTLRSDCGRQHLL